MRPWFDVPPLEGSLVRLEPLAASHAKDLAIAAEEDRGSYGLTLVPRAGEIDSYLAAQFARAEQGMTPFAQIRRSDSRAVGCTAYWDPRYWPGRDSLRAIEIGFTWLAASAQASGINTEAKLLLMSHAFEHLGVARVDLKTDARNERSRRAIEALGGTFEGRRPRPANRAPCHALASTGSEPDRSPACRRFVISRRFGTDTVTPSRSSCSCNRRPASVVCRSVAHRERSMARR